jgi:hypothetical protein
VTGCYFKPGQFGLQLLDPSIQCIDVRARHAMD